MYTDSEDEKKRKRESPSPFRSSRKITRTPEDRKEDDLKEVLKQIHEELKQIRRENQEYREEVGKIREENSIMRKELDETRKRIIYVEDKLEYMEREKIRNNIVLKGMELRSADREGFKNQVKKFLHEQVGVTVEIRRVRRINEIMCVAEVNSWEEKLSIMENKRKLGSLKTMKVYIDNDLTRREQEVQRKIREVAKNERSKGKEARVGYNKLWINGEKWVWNGRTESLERCRRDKAEGGKRDEQEKEDSKN